MYCLKYRQEGKMIIFCNYYHYYKNVLLVHITFSSLR